MKNFTLIICLLFLSAFTVKAQKKVYTIRKSLVKFVSEAPLEVIKASSSQLKGYLDPDKRLFTFIIPSTSFVGFNSPLQQIHFYENYMEAQKYPESKFVGKIIEQVDFNTDGDYQVRAKGILSIHGVDQERIIKVRIRINKGILNATSDFSILLQEYNITIPKVVYQKIAEEIFINVNLEMNRK
ncbi:MAG: YceI family protein [Bacteroidetes bacterium]|nr:YceI family protein [Bacteroidota bacterium]